MRKEKKSLLEDRRIGPFLMDGVDMIAIGSVLAVLVLFTIFRNYCGVVVVYGISMSPTLQDGEVRWTDPRFGVPERGDIVVFHAPGKKDYVKRVAALPGETVQIKDGVIYVDGEAQETPFPDMEDAGLASEPFTLGDDEYFVLGDNRNASNDSRFIGPVKRKDIVSRVGAKIF